jgi:hypothetical protein
MSNFNRVVFEDGKGGLRDEEGVELMKVDELDVQVRKLVTMEYYLNQQLDIEAEMLESEEKPVMNTDLKKKKKKYTIYSEYDKMNFILHMLTKAPKKIALVARKYNINERAGGINTRTIRIHFSCQKLETIARSSTKNTKLF